MHTAFFYGGMSCPRVQDYLIFLVGGTERCSLDRIAIFFVTVKQIRYSDFTQYLSWRFPDKSYAVSLGDNLDITRKENQFMKVF